MNLKLPGKRFLGNNFDPEFIRARREGLHEFVMKLMRVSRPGREGEAAQVCHEVDEGEWTREGG